MVRVSVMYPNAPGATFDMVYYRTRHFALVERLLGKVLTGSAVDQGLATPDAPAPYLVIGHLLFESAEAFQAAMAEHGPALMADIPNYTKIQPVIQVSHVEFSSGISAASAVG